MKLDIWYIEVFSYKFLGYDFTLLQSIEVFILMWHDLKEIFNVLVGCWNI